ncbi:hypothetical protein GCM10009835_31540 [Planosporangium flavigriseum]
MSEPSAPVTGAPVSSLPAIRPPPCQSAELPGKLTVGHELREQAYRDFAGPLSTGGHRDRAGKTMTLQTKAKPPQTVDGLRGLPPVK